MSTYTVEMATEGNEQTLVTTFSSEAEAIEKARDLAGDADAGVAIYVNQDGEEIWNNEGDWRSAPSAQVSSGI